MMHRRYLLISVIAVAVIAMAVVVYTRQHTHRHEAFVAATAQPNASAQLRQAFGDEKCNLLSSAQLSGDAKVMARQYVDGNRVRTYKPKGKHTAGDQCYVNHDPANATDDYLLAGQACDKQTNPLLRDAPFITSARLDDQPEASNDATVRKCVLQLDKAKITTAALQQFWESVGTSDCARMNQSTIDTHAELTLQLAELTQRYNTLLGQQSELAATLQQQAQDDARLRASIASLMQEEANKQASLKQLQDQAQALAKQKVEEERACTLKLEGMAQQLARCAKQLEDTHASYTSLDTRQQQTAAALSTATAQLSAAKQTFKALSAQATALSAEKQSLESDYATTVNALAASEQQRTVCQAQSSDCSDAVQDYEQVLPPLQAQSAACAAQLQDCQTYLQRMLSETAALKARNDAAQQRLNNTRNSLTDCMATNAALNARITGQNLDIDNLQKNAEQAVCAQYDPIIADLTNRRDALVDKCSRLESASATLSTGRTPLLDAQVKRLQGEASACAS